MGKRNITNKLVLLALGLAPAMAFGAGLGKLTVLSGLGQPLRAEIEIVALQKGELETLSARLASMQAFREANLDYSTMLRSLNFSVERRGSRPVVLVTSQRPVDDPFLDLLVELNWQNGRLVREYTVPARSRRLQGTPGHHRAAGRAAGTGRHRAGRSRRRRSSSAPRRRPLRRPALRRRPHRAPPRRVRISSSPATRSPRSRRQNRPEGVSLQQMLVALYRANEDAFISKNMNLVKSGRTLTIPDKGAVQAVAPEEANKVVIAQTQDFNEYRARVGQAVAAAPDRPADGGAARQRPRHREGRGRHAGSGRCAERPAAPVEARRRRRQGRHHRRRSRCARQGREGSAGARRRAGEERRRPAEAAGDEEPAARRHAEAVAGREAAGRAGGAAGAGCQGAGTRAESCRTAQAGRSPEGRGSAEGRGAQARRPAEGRGAQARRPAEGRRSPCGCSGAGASPRACPTAEAPKPKPKVVAPPPPPEPSFVDELLDNPIALGGGAAGLLALLGLGAYAVRRKRNARLENSLLGVTTTDTSSVFGTTGGRNVDTGASSLQTDFSQGGIGAIDTDEVDPVAEADVYMAYGRDAQAEEILKEALQKDPNRQSVRVKLLEIYASRKDLKAFETTAGELYAATGGQGAEWDKACQLGLSIDPTNPMYGGKASDPSSTLPPGTVILPGAAAAAAAAAPAPSPDIALDADNEEPPALDFDLGGSGAPTAAAAPDIALDVGTPSQLPADLGFDLNLGDTTDQAGRRGERLLAFRHVHHGRRHQARGHRDGSGDAERRDRPADRLRAAGHEADPAFDQTAKMEASQPTNVLDFDLGGAKPSAKSQPVDVASISFDLGEPSTQAPPVDSRWQEVATKLDLAKAYEEMGDKDGARELLNEVMKEGDNAQQQQAKTLLEAMR